MPTFGSKNSLYVIVHSVGERICGVSLERRSDVTVYVCSDGDAGVAKAFLDDF